MLDKIPAEYRSELAALEKLDDDNLWVVAESEMPEKLQKKMNRLLSKNRAGTLTLREHEALDRLRVEADRLMLRKSYAYVLLKRRGHKIPDLAELMKV
jgi:hypothetical protein